MKTPFLLSPTALLLAWGLALPNFASGGSLWNSPDNSQQALVADRRASQVGDILTVQIQENQSASTSQRRATDSDAGITAGVSQFLFPPAVSKFGTKGGELPGIEMGGGNNFSGGGQVNSTQRLTARAAVVVTDVLPNGNLVIAGVRRVSFGGETQHIVLQGMVNPSDISARNVIFSENIAAATVEVLNDGDLANASKHGWISKIYEAVRPF